MSRLLLRGFHLRGLGDRATDRQVGHQGSDAIFRLEAHITFREVDLDVAGHHFEDFAAHLFEQLRIEVTAVVSQHQLEPLEALFTWMLQLKALPWLLGLVLLWLFAGETDRQRSS